MTATFVDTLEDIGCEVCIYGKVDVGGNVIEVCLPAGDELSFSHIQSDLPQYFSHTTAKPSTSLRTARSSRSTRRRPVRCSPGAPTQPAA
eukprot:SAG11_NODE_2946_length_2820_cov_2.023153_4_plen_90_part_00